MRSLLIVAVSVALVAGCFGKEEAPVERVFSASGGKVSAGWDYAGAATTPGSASLSGTVNDPENRGLVNASFTHAGSQWVVTFDQFAGTQDFMDGGVRFGFAEHGDTGVADASIPRINARVAAWGTATVTRDGTPVAGAAGDRWAAHLMLSDDTVRGSDNRILNAAGSAPYDPSKPADGKVTTGDAQALLKLVHPDGETAARAPLNASNVLSFAGPETTLSVEIPAEAGAASLTVNVTISGPQSAPVGVGRATITLLDAGGNATKTQEMTVAPNQPTTATFELTAAEVTGPLTLEVRGLGAFTATVDYVVTFDDHPFLVLTWDEPTVS